jgi:hypothetical protein
VGVAAYRGSQEEGAGSPVEPPFPEAFQEAFPGTQEPSQAAASHMPQSLEEASSACQENPEIQVGVGLQSTRVEAPSLQEQAHQLRGLDQQAQLALLMRTERRQQ